VGLWMRGTSFLILSFVALLFCVTTVAGQDAPFDPSRTVLPITKVKIGFALGVTATTRFGTGFCLDVRCKFIGTNYHVAASTGSSLKIKGEKVRKSYLASSPTDKGATVNQAMDPKVGLIEFNLAHDFAIYELERPLADKGMRGVKFSLDDLDENQEVDIYAYPLTNRFQVKRSLTRFPATFMGRTQEGLLAFNFKRSETGRTIKPGASGGLIINRRTQQAVGVLIGVAGRTNIAAAVSVQSLAEFIKKVNPDLFTELFPSQMPQDFASVRFFGDIYPKYIPPAKVSGVVQHREEESAEVKLLRKKAQELTDSIRDFIAVQTLEYGGMKIPPAPQQYEIQVIDGRQQFRKFSDAQSELPDIPLPIADPVVNPGGEWSKLPALVGTELRLKIMEAPDAVIAGRRVKVFQFRGDIEDNVCHLRAIDDYLLFQRDRLYTVACEGEVWTDDDFNILRISENQDLPQEAGWRNYRAVVTYGWLNKPEDSKRLVPTAFVVQAESDGKLYWCQGQFTNYRVFSARAKLLQ
jgi:hypothetical protein